MRMIEAVAARLYQPVKMAANLGIELPSSNLVSENQIHNAIWRCICCRHGQECGEWFVLGRLASPNSARIANSIWDAPVTPRSLRSGRVANYLLRWFSSRAVGPIGQGMQLC